MKKIIMIMLITIIIAVPIYAKETWYSDGYEWANAQEIIGKKTDAQLAQNVHSEEFYDMLFKYLELRHVTSIGETQGYYKSDDYKTDNYILVAADKQLTYYVAKDWLTNVEYKKAVTLIENATNILDKNPDYFTKSEIESTKYYLEVMNYLLYTKIYDYDYKNQVFAAKPKNADLFVKYGLIPYYGEISREEFLNIVYYYTVARGNPVSTATTVGYYRYNDVLRGYDNNLMLTNKLTYAHFVTFISRM